MVTGEFLDVNALKHHHVALQGTLLISATINSIRLVRKQLLILIGVYILHKYRFHDLTTNWFGSNPLCAASIHLVSANEKYESYFFFIFKDFPLIEFIEGCSFRISLNNECNPSMFTGLLLVFVIISGIRFFN